MASFHLLTTFSGRNTRSYITNLLRCAVISFADVISFIRPMCVPPSLRWTNRALVEARPAARKRKLPRRRTLSRRTDGTRVTLSAASECAASDYSASDCTGSEFAASDCTASDRTASDCAASDCAASEYAASEYAASDSSGIALFTFLFSSLLEVLLCDAAGFLGIGIGSI